jgi:hypothetical protein
MSDTLPFLQEHEAPKVSTTPPLDYEPTPEERKTVKKIEKMFQAAKSYRSNYDHNWLDWYKMFRGKQWKEERPSYRNSAVFNLIFQAIQSQVPILTDSRPKFEYLPMEPQDREFAELMNQIALSEWESKNYLYKETEVIFEGHLYGTGISELVYDEEADNGEGGIVYRSKDVFYFFPDPDAESLEEKCDFVIVAEPMTVEKVKRRYPEKAKYIKSDIVETLDAVKNDLQPARSRSPVNDRLIMEGSGLKLTEEQKKVTVICAYYRDDTVDEQEKREVGEDGLESVVYEQRLKYPGLRKTVIANGVVLADGPNEYDDGLLPYQRFINYVLPHEFWGVSEIEQLEGPQKTFNKLMSFVLDVLTLMGNPIWVVDHNSGIDPYNLTNAPGLVVEKTPGSEVRREAGVQLQPYVIQVMQLVQELHNQISGAQDITRGINPSGVTAASAIADLQNAAQTRIRQKARNLDAYLQRLGEQFASRVMQFYTAPKVFRMTGHDGVDQYFRAFFKKSEDGYTVAQVQRYTEDGLPSAEIDEYTLRGKLDVRVTTGTSLPFSKDQKRRELEGLFDRGIIDDEEFLKSIDYPNYEAVLERKRQKEEQLAAAQAQGQAPA